MSSITRITCRKGIFLIRDCLEEVLVEMNYSNQTRVVQNSDNTYSLEISKVGDDLRRNEILPILEKKMVEILPKIHQNYAIKVAIRELTSKGFRLEKQRSVNENLEYTFDKMESNQLKRMIITVYPDYRVTINSVGFLHRTCDNFTKGIESGLGGSILKEYKSDVIGDKLRVSNRTKQQNRLKLGLGGNKFQ